MLEETNLAVFKLDLVGVLERLVIGFGEGVSVAFVGGCGCGFGIGGLVWFGGGGVEV